MKPTFLALLVLAGAALGPSRVDAQLGPGSVIRCESRDGRSRECPVGYARDARLLRQLSRSACIEGETWGVTRRAIWVSGGCRGEFAIDDRGRGYDSGIGHGGIQHLRCESDDGRWNRCDAPRGRVELIRQLSRSACVRGQSWGTDGRGIWVSGGCRAEFRVEPRGGYGAPAAERFICESTNGGERFCPAGGAGPVQLVRQISRSTCVEGHSWGRARDGVWVAHGCRAEFEAGGRGRRWD